MRDEFGRETFLVEDIEEFENLDASEIHAWRLNAKEVITLRNGDNFMFPIADGTVIMRRRSGSENIHFNTGQSRRGRETRRCSWTIKRVSSIRLTSG